MSGVLGKDSCKISSQAGNWYNFLTKSFLQDFDLWSMRSAIVPSRRLFSNKEMFKH